MGTKLSRNQGEENSGKRPDKGMLHGLTAGTFQTCSRNRKKAGESRLEVGIGDQWKKRAERYGASDQVEAGRTLSSLLMKGDPLEILNQSMNMI